MKTLDEIKQMMAVGDTAQAGEAPLLMVIYGFDKWWRLLAASLTMNVSSCLTRGFIAL